MKLSCGWFWIDLSLTGRSRYLLNYGIASIRRSLTSNTLILDNHFMNFGNFCCVTYLFGLVCFNSLGQFWNLIVSKFSCCYHFFWMWYQLTRFSYLSEISRRQRTIIGCVIFITLDNAGRLKRVSLEIRGQILLRRHFFIRRILLIRYNLLEFYRAWAKCPWLIHTHNFLSHMGWETSINDLLRYSVA